MKICMQSIDMGIWDAILNDPFIPMHVVKYENVKKAWFEWSETEKKRAQYDSVAKKYYYICFEYG